VRGLALSYSGDDRLTCYRPMPAAIGNGTRRPLSVSVVRFAFVILLHFGECGHQPMSSMAFSPLACSLPLCA
jgi:hypothetical protein